MLRFPIDEHAEMRLFVETDAPKLFSVVDANREHLQEWLPWLDRNTEEAHSRQFINSTIDQYRKGRGFVCGIFSRGQVVGTCGYHPIEPCDSEVTIGYWLSRDAVGKGLVTRATAILIDYAFDELALTKVSIPVAVGNYRSRAVCERLGLDNEGVKSDAEYLYDKYVDHFLYYTTPYAWKGRGI